MKKFSTVEYPSILAQLYDALASVTKGQIAVNEDTELVGQLDLDSLQIMDVLMSMEDRLDISIPVSILPDVKTVRDLALQITKLTRAECGNL